ncbi:MAG: hypothetical protein CSA15_12970 [Candidatus Delongbacteria bacterium]|nr:MAG: hypothetical protein CSA15_12970 [Candidatus Delongbacteria bacterium]
MNLIRNYIINKNRTVLNSVKKLKKEISINGYKESRNPEGNFSYAPGICLDHKNFIYILDHSTSSIKKFDEKGEFITSFCSNGSGPGEVNNSFDITNLGDTIYIQDTEQARMAMFTRSGEFIKFKNLPNGELPMFLRKVGMDKFLGYSQTWQDDENRTTFYLNLYDSNFKKIKSLFKKTKKIGNRAINYFERFPVFTVSDSLIYLSTNSTKLYEIDVYSLNGEFKHKITRGYRKLLFGEKELKDIIPDLKRVTGASTNKNIKIEKRSINGLFYNNDSLWVLYSVDRDDKNNNLFFDIFKNGILVEKVKIINNQFKHKDLFNLNSYIYKIENDIIYYLDCDNSKVELYEIVDRDD